MRICLLVHAHPALSRGGGETAAWREMHALRAAGHEAVMIAAAEHPPAEWPALPAGESLYALAAMEPDRLGWAEKGACWPPGRRCSTCTTFGVSDSISSPRCGRRGRMRGWSSPCTRCCRSAPIMAR